MSNEPTSFFSRYLERIVTVLTPTVFAPLAALMTKLIAVNLPSVHASSGQITALEIAGFTGACTAAAHWLHGRQIETVKMKASGLVRPVEGMLVSAGISQTQQHDFIHTTIKDLEGLAEHAAGLAVEKLGQKAPIHFVHEETKLQPAASINTPISPIPVAPTPDEPPIPPAVDPAPGTPVQPADQGAAPAQ